MTCIAGVVERATGRVWMGADCAGSGDWDLTLIRAPKIVRNGDFLLGVTGHPRVCQILEHAFTPPDHPSDMTLERYIVTRFTDALREAFKAAGYARKDNEQEKHESEVLIGYRGRLFAIEGNYQMVEPQESYYAVGSGDMAALGALYATVAAAQDGLIAPAARVRLALEAAERFNIGVRGPFTIVSLESPALVALSVPVPDGTAAANGHAAPQQGTRLIGIIAAAGGVAGN